MKKIFFYIVMMFAIVSITSCGRDNNSKQTSKVESEESGEEEETIDADPAPDISRTDSVVRMTGKLSLDPQDRAEISPIVNGLIRSILVKEGTRVRKNQIVAYIENTEVVALQRQYLQAYNERQAAQLELDRQRTLMNQGAGVQKTLQQAESAYAIITSQMEGIGRQLSQIGVKPSLSGKFSTLIPVRSPISGIVGKIVVSMGSFVDVSTSLMQVVNNENIHADLKVFEKDLPKIHIGQELSITLTNTPKVKFKAKIYDINSTFDDASKSVTVHARITEKPDFKLLPDMFINGVLE
ncbi:MULTISPECIES: efflux RND transporter periplasmic adaptor subunit [Bacteroidales]|uniref:efflux RND transporter periplasmic adaptor subunit n=1 Tax=Prevotella heparinolytica TaxID=28113 RepID=UPI002A7F59C3|nr:efflux RND transporter periplasmic adaptor subunit [Prevotella sp.]MDY4020102.1 efflux RND transporter periplasmic adaptor subunit [Prevotella sp.]